MTSYPIEEAQTHQEQGWDQCVALPCWTFNRRFCAESAINLWDRSQKVIGIPEWMAAAGSWNRSCHRSFSLMSCPKKEPSQRHCLVVAIWTVYAETGKSVQQGARANVLRCHAACYPRNSEMKLQIASRQPARGAPAKAVAHL